MCIQGSTFQFVLATNGQYTYGIILFVSVEPAASGDSALVFGIDENYNFPYAPDIANVASNTNTVYQGSMLQI